jgi:hypothetical protein
MMRTHFLYGCEEDRETFYAIIRPRALQVAGAAAAPQLAMAALLPNCEAGLNHP